MTFLEQDFNFPHEDRQFGGNSLFVDLIPATSWFKNVRSEIPKKVWDSIRKSVYARANDTCEICGRTPAKKNGDRIECHERWEYLPGPKPGTGIQRLKRFIALCSACHESTHMGLAEVRGRGEIAKAHFKKVTGMSDQEVRKHIRQAFEIWERRSEMEWILEMPLLEDLIPTISGNKKEC
jgi:hypothetical protein